MNGIFGFVLAVLIYPGVLVALLAAWALTWTRESARGAVTSGGTAGLVPPLRTVREVRGTLERDTTAPRGVSSWVLAFGSLMAIVCPLVALILLPAPGNPLVRALGLPADLTAEGALLVGLPVARLVVGWAIPSPYTRLAADRSARLLAGAVVPMVLALAATAEQIGTLALNLAPAKSGPSALELVTRVLAAAAFACALPVLARTSAGREGDGDLELEGGELGELSGRDLASFRIGETLQLVAAAALFIAAFVLPIFATVPDGVGRGVIWVAGLLLTAAGIGAWEGYAKRHPLSADRPPLSWWLGIPLLLSLVALVAAAWASRGI